MARQDPNEYVEVDVEFIHETENAYCVNDGMAEDIWIPKAHADYDKDTGIITVKYWKAEELGLI